MNRQNILEYIVKIYFLLSFGFECLFEPNFFFLPKIGFEEDENFHVVLNFVIARCCHVIEYLGSIAFSKAI